MASAIHLCNGSMPANHPRLASGTIGVASRPSRVHLGLCQPSYFLSNCSKNRLVARPGWRVNCMLENSSLPSKNEENENNIVRAMTGISLALACVLGVFSFKGMMDSKSATASALTKKGSFSSREPSASDGQIGPQMGGELALDSLVKMLKCAPIPPDTSDRPQLPKMPSKAEIDELKFYAVGLSKFGKPHDAFKLLHDAFKKYKDQPEAKQFLKMALIELLIFQENYPEARKRLDQLIKDKIGGQGFKRKRQREEDKIKQLEDDPMKFLNPQIFLYKAFVHTMLNSRDAAVWWEAFGNTVG